MAFVSAIFVCPEMGLEMNKVEVPIKAIAGVGLEGDRYAKNIGAYSNSKPPKIRHVTFIAIEAITEANILLDDEFLAIETRRNILTVGVDLNALIGKKFFVGDVKFRGTELCAPCDRPTKLSGKKYFKDAFDTRGGLRAEILSSGEICVGDKIIVL